MAMIVRAFPLKKGCSRADVDAFVGELEERRQEISRWHAGHGVTHESWYLQETGAGPWVIVINEGTDVKENSQQFAQANTELDAWFMARVQDLTGVDLRSAPLGPPTLPIYEWSRDEPTRAKFEPYRG